MRNRCKSIWSCSIEEGAACCADNCRGCTVLGHSCPYRACLGQSVLMRVCYLSALWLITASFLAPATSIGQTGTEQEPLSITTEPTAADVVTSANFHLPRSSLHSIYFLPGSADLNESASTCISTIAARLEADPALRVSVVGHADDFSEGVDSEALRNTRAVALADALSSLGISRNRISTTTSHEDVQGAAHCTSEYCRQSYRRVEVLFMRLSYK